MYDVVGKDAVVRMLRASANACGGSQQANKRMHATASRQAEKLMHVTVEGWEVTGLGSRYGTLRA